MRKTLEDLYYGNITPCEQQMIPGSDVAEQVGFQDLAHFSRVFKKLEGMSAGEYRNTHWGTEQQGG